jgi:hypothetical protein
MAAGEADAGSAFPLPERANASLVEVNPVQVTGNIHR